VLPGQALMTLADVSKLQVETTDLSERDIPRVSLGQKASVTIKSLNQTVAGKVSAISALADSLGGDVVYQTTIDLDNQPAGLRAGMSVEVQFLTE
jgi:multidrug resistance efflux pump